MPPPESHCTTEPAAKLVPETVRLNDAPPATANAGINPAELIVVGVPMVNSAALEVVPPGFCTVIAAVPATATRLLGTDALRVVAPMNWVERECGFGGP